MKPISFILLLCYLLILLPYLSLQQTTTSSSSTIQCPINYILGENNQTCIIITNHPKFLTTCTLENPCNSNNFHCHLGKCVPCINNKFYSNIGMYCKGYLFVSSVGWDGYFEKSIFLWLFFIGILVLYLILYLFINFFKYNNSKFKKQYNSYIYEHITSYINNYY